MSTEPEKPWWPSWMAAPCERDWPEDARDDPDNGMYFNNCLSCTLKFVGNKRRLTCRKCHDEYQAYLASLTPEERWALQEKQKAEVLEWVRKNITNKSSS